VLVLPGNDGCPTLQDIAVGLGRMPRWAGATKRTYTVLQHSLACEEYVRLGKHKPLTRLYTILHDAHEAVTGDVPTSWKTGELRRWQDRLDKRIWASLSLPEPGPAEQLVIESCDRAILWAEAQLLGNPAHAEYYFTMPRDDLAERCTRTMQNATSKISLIRAFLVRVDELRRAI